MEIASEHIKRSLAFDCLTDEQLLACIGYFHQMFLGRPVVPETFEVVYNAIVRTNLFRWQLYEQGRWINIEWNLAKTKQGQRVHRRGAAWYSIDLCFPTVDFIFVEDFQKQKKTNQVFVTSREPHQNDFSL